MIDDARSAVGGSGGGGAAAAGRSGALGAEDDGEAAAAAASAAREAAQSVWQEVAVLDSRIEVVLHALVEAGRLMAGVEGELKS
jgi:hypothetical protein